MKKIGFLFSFVAIISCQAQQKNDILPSEVTVPVSTVDDYFSAETYRIHFFQNQLVQFQMGV